MTPLAKKLTVRHAVLLICCILIIGHAIFSKETAAQAADRSFPPFYVKKLAPGDQFTPFEITDLEGRTWTNKNYLARPLLLITGKWELRHDLRKWAEHLNLNYILQADILWVFNPNAGWFEDRRKRSEDAFKEFKATVPTLIDSHSLVGRSLKIEYDIPTIIGIDQHNRYQFCLESPFNKAGSKMLAALVRNKLLR